MDFYPTEPFGRGKGARWMRALADRMRLSFWLNIKI